MKYMQEGGFQSHPLMRVSLGLTLVLLLGFWVTNFAIYFSRMGLGPQSVVAYYNGSETEFRPPRSAGSMLETSHAHLPMMGLVLLFLTHLAIFAPLTRPAKLGLMALAFGSAVCDEAGGWLVRFVSPAFAPLKVAGFVGLQSAIGLLLVVLGTLLASGSRRRPSLDESGEGGPLEGKSAGRRRD